MIDARVPPYDQGAEAAVLGSVLLNNEALARVLPIVAPGHFYVESSRRIYQSMIDISRSGKPVDIVTLGNHMMQLGQLERVGGAMAFNDLTDAVSTIANVEHYAKLVRSHAVVRKIIYASMEISAKGYSGINDVPAYVEEANRAMLLASQGLDVGNGPQHIDETLIEIFGELENGEEPRGMVKTGIGPIDSVTGGLWPGLLTVVAGRPAMGKSSFVLNIATNVALNGKKVLYVTLEDARKYVVMRMLSRYADIDLADLSLRKVKDDELRRLVDASNKLSGKKPIWIEDTTGLSSSAIRQIVISHKMYHGLDLVIIDHLGEVNDEGDSDTQITSNATKAFRDLAKDLDIPVLLASQLNRKVEERKDKRPILSDLKNSGKIEEAARVVWFLYRPGYYESDGEDWRELELLVSKANHGKTGTLRLFSDLSRMHVRGWDPEVDGLFHGDPAGEGHSARTDAQDRKATSTQQGFFEGGYTRAPKEDY